MTYCIAMRLEQGLLFGADTRTNAGVDHISTFRKLHCFHKPNSHAIVLLCSGNLATSQMVIEHLKRNIDRAKRHLLEVNSLFDAAILVGRLLKTVIEDAAGDDKNDQQTFTGNIILGGQIKEESHRLFLIYPQGNFIEATEETPYLQIGEHKYGKPIVDRSVEYYTPLPRALNAMFVSLDSTIKSNLSVGLPIDVLIYERDSFDISRQRRFFEQDPEFIAVRQHWNQGVNELLANLPTPNI
jgi:putative proteasome-type protease